MVAHVAGTATGDAARRRVLQAETAARALTTVRLGIELLSVTSRAELSALDRTLLIRAIACATEEVTDAVTLALEVPGGGERRASARETVTRPPR